MKLTDEHHDENCIPTEEALEIAKTCMKTELSDWYPLHKAQKDNRHHKKTKKSKSLDEQPLTFECDGGISERWSGISIPGLTTKIYITTAKTVDTYRMTSTLYRTQDRVTNRVIQVETGHPLPNTMKDPHWPHLHLGHQYWKLENGVDPCDFHGNLKIFSEKSNVEITPELENPLEPGVLKLTG